MSHGRYTPIQIVAFLRAEAREKASYTAIASTAPNPMLSITCAEVADILHNIQSRKAEFADVL